MQTSSGDINFSQAAFLQAMQQQQRWQQQQQQQRQQQEQQQFLLSNPGLAAMLLQRSMSGQSPKAPAQAAWNMPPQALNGSRESSGTLDVPAGGGHMPQSPTTPTLHAHNVLGQTLSSSTRATQQQQQQQHMLACQSPAGNGAAMDGGPNTSDMASQARPDTSSTLLHHFHRDAEETTCCKLTLPCCFEMVA
jgi:predicted ATP-dependent protease